MLGIGDASYDAIGEDCRRSLTEYYAVRSLENYDEVLRAVAFFIFKYGPIDYVDSQNEYWLELEARLRTDFNIPTGFKTADMDAVKRKSRMKEGYARAGVKTARFHLVTDREGCLAFIREVGYPVVVKPDNGVGASNTDKLNSDEEFEAFYDPTSYVNQHRSDYAHNHSQWQSDELAALIDKLNIEDGTDFAARWAHLGEANKYLLDNAVVIPLEQATKEFLVNPALKGYVTKQLGYGVFDLTRAYFEE